METFLEGYEVVWEVNGALEVENAFGLDCHASYAERSLLEIEVALEETMENDL